MYTYDLKVGYSCNNNCKHCVIDDNKEKLLKHHIKINLSTKECLEKIDNAAMSGAKAIVLTGGEITIRKDFLKLIQRCYDNNLYIIVQTNGRNLSNLQTIEYLKNIHNIKFIIALHGNKEIHDNITRSAGSFDETCSSIKNLCNIQKLVILKIVISKINLFQLVDILKIGMNLGVKYFCFAFPHGLGSARKNFNDIVPTFSSLKLILQNLISEAKALNANLEFEAIPFCIIPNNMQLVGELKYFFDKETICEPVNEASFHWNEIRHSIKKKGINCEKCDMNIFCEGVWEEYIDIFGDSELYPIKFHTDEKDIIIHNIKNYLIKHK